MLTAIKDSTQSLDGSAADSLYSSSRKKMALEYSWCRSAATATRGSCRGIGRPFRSMYSITDMIVSTVEVGQVGDVRIVANIVTKWSRTSCVSEWDHRARKLTLNKSIATHRSAATTV